MIYTTVDEGYNVSVSKTRKGLAILLDGFFLEDGTPVNEKSIQKFFSTSKNSVLYVYSSDETRHWSYANSTGLTFRVPNGSFS